MAGRSASGSGPGPKKESSSPKWVIRKPSGKNKRERREQNQSGEGENREPENYSRRSSWRKNGSPGQDRRPRPAQNSGEKIPVRPEPRSRRPDQQFQQNKRPRPAQDSGAHAKDPRQAFPEPVQTPPITSRQRMARVFEKERPVRKTVLPPKRSEGQTRQETGSRPARQFGDRKPPARPQPVPERYEKKPAPGKSDRPLAEFEEYVPEHRTRRLGNEPEVPVRQTQKTRPAHKAGMVQSPEQAPRNSRVPADRAGPVERKRPDRSPDEAHGEKQKFLSRRNSKPKSKKPAGLPLLKHEGRRAQKSESRGSKKGTNTGSGEKVVRTARKWGISEQGRKS